MKGLPFNIDMARAWHEGRKTVHRALMKKQPLHLLSVHPDTGATIERWENASPPRYQPGEVVYIQEPWHLCGANAPGGEPHTEVIYQADSDTCVYCVAVVAWKSPITMPEHFSRSNARILTVRPEQIRTIGADSIRAEGFPAHDSNCLAAERECFARYWESRHPGSWQKNDWVWVYGLEEIASGRYCADCGTLIGPDEWHCSKCGGCL